MKDRIVEHPARYQLVPVAGTTDQFDLVAVPGIVTEAGSDINKANMLPDATVSAIEEALGVDLPADAMIKDAFNALAYKPVKITTGSYTGTGTYGVSNPIVITLPVGCKFFCLYSGTDYYSTGIGSSYAFPHVYCSLFLNVDDLTSDYVIFYSAYSSLYIKVVENTLYYYADSNEHQYNYLFTANGNTVYRRYHYCTISI